MDDPEQAELPGLHGVDEGPGAVADRGVDCDAIVGALDVMFDGDGHLARTAKGYDN